VLTPTPIPDPAAFVLLPGAGYIELLTFALTAAVVWLVLEHRRRRAQTRDLTRERWRWELAYWHLLATATCPLCGSRMEPERTAPLHEASRGELS